jgi:hypothetical protein
VYRIGYDGSVSRVQEIEEQLRTLSGPELRELRTWLDEFEAQRWDDQIAVDSNTGKLNQLLQRALKDEEEGNTTPL